MNLLKEERGGPVPARDRKLGAPLYVHRLILSSSAPESSVGRLTDRGFSLLDRLLLALALVHPPIPRVPSGKAPEEACSAPLVPGVASEKTPDTGPFYPPGTGLGSRDACPGEEQGDSANRQTISKYY